MDQPAQLGFGRHHSEYLQSGKQVVRNERETGYLKEVLPTRFKSVIVLLAVVFFTISAFAEEAEENACEMLFVQDAKATSFDGRRLTLKGTKPHIIFFCDRPVRTAGNLTRDAFMKLVSEGVDIFAVNPPNAAV
jgi:hypothetical protein